MSESPALPHPGVRFPPPFVYFGGLLVGWALNRRWPLPIAIVGDGSLRVVAAICIVGAAALLASAFASFRRANTTFIPNRPASAFVAAGPFRFTRNPMYVGMAVIYVGVALLIGNWWPLLVLPIVLAIIQISVIAREERYLDGAFPVEYPAYRARVRRWI